MATVLDCKLSCSALGICLPPIRIMRQHMQGLVSETGGFEALSEPAEKVWCVQGSAFCGQKTMPPEKLQRVLWKQCFADPTAWSDNRWSISTPQHPDFRHKKSKIALALDSRHKPAWVDFQLGRWDAEREKTQETVSTSVEDQGNLVAHESDLEVGMCSRLCEEGRISDAVDALNLLVQRGRYVDNNLFYRVLKWCVLHKDLAVGRRIHALTVKSGYEGDAFLATHLIGLYASHGRLEEAMRVFTKVSSPDAYNWATIIFACAKHGDAVQGIRLYQQMRESTAVQPNNRIYVAVLKACATAEDLVAGKEVHAHILASAGKPDIFVQNGLVDMYVKCRSLQDARRVFDRVPARNVVTWTTMIAGYAQQRMGPEALSLYSTMQLEGLTPPNSVTYVCLLQACASVGLGALHKGKQLHAQIKERGLQENVVVGGSLVNMYAKCESLEDARRVFDRLPARNVVAWNAILAGYAQKGMGQEALSLYGRMQQEGLDRPDSVTYTCLLQACASLGVGGLLQGKQLHAEIQEIRLREDIVLGCSLVNMYAKCGSLKDARRVFDRLPAKNVVTWTAMIAGYVQQGMGKEALTLHRSMRQQGLSLLDSVTYVCLLQACARVGAGALHEGTQLHAQIKERGLQLDVVLGGSLVNMYAKCGSLEDARIVFDILPCRDVVTWTAIIAGYVQQGMGQEALTLYRSMQQEGLFPPDFATFTCLLHACASVGAGALHEGKQLHVQIEERGLLDDAVLAGSLVNMYAKCGSLEHARGVFDMLPARDVVTWTAMIAGYVQQEMGQEALVLYRSMQQQGLSPDSITYACLVRACASVGVGALHEGKQLHAQIQERGLQEDVVLGGSLVNMYAKCGSLTDARTLFDILQTRDVVTWTTMIAGYVQQGMGEEALSLYKGMQREGLTPANSVTYACLLHACAAVAALPLGKELHAEIEERGMQTDVVLGAALVDMYAKCGSMFESQQVFDSLPERSVETWGALISGYAHQGDSDVVFDLLDRMRMEGIQPDGVTFLSVLTVCSHVGLVDKGREYFQAMRTEYGISATVEHFTCMMDLLGRAGHLEDALKMTKTMPFPPNDAVWHTLLGACLKWKNVEIGQQAFEGAVSMDKKDAASYVLMSNIYASAKMWDAAKEMHAIREELGAWKKPGQSWWIDMDGVVHTFVVGDKNHPETEGIYSRLEQLVPKMSKEGSTCSRG